jgi:hypothetical protein
MGAHGFGLDGGGRENGLGLTHTFSTGLMTERHKSEKLDVSKESGILLSENR